MGAKGKFRDLAGKQFDRWTVVQLAERRSRSCYWLCRCICGKEKVIRSSALTCRQSRSCGCLAKELLSIRAKKLFTKTDSGAREVYRRYKRHAEDSRREFAISLEEFLVITALPCFYCGASPHRRNRKGSLFIYNGIDRVNNSVGYIKENCVACCLFCNWMKGRISQIEFLERCRNIAAKHP